MLSLGKRNKKGIAATFLLLLTVETFYPAAAYALTSGPVQPEMQKFQPAGVSNMVDLFSGDFKYDIPLMDVGGYPVNISYHSGAGMEDEASWVGMGWTLSPGSVNRNMRGIPDDFNGKATDGMPDRIKTAQHQKNFYKIGGQLVVKYTGFALEIGTPSLHLDVYKDNYYGMGGSVGASLNLNLLHLGAGSLTAGLGLNSDPRTGVTLQPSLSLSASYDDGKESNGGSLTGGFTYNTRKGLTEESLGATFDSKSTVFDDFGNASASGSVELGVGSITKDFSHGYTPTIGTNKSSSFNTLSLDLGPALFGGYWGIGGSGYIYTEKNTEETSNLPAFGYMNYQAGSQNTNAFLDFNREKDITFLTNAPSIPIPVATQDYFTASSQAGTQQFRPWYNGEYTVFDRSYHTSYSDKKLGITIGAGEVFQGGGRLDVTKVSSTTNRWDNNYTKSADGAMPSSVLNENIFFKRSGELTMADADYYSLLKNDATQKVSLNAGFSSTPQTAAKLVINNIESAAPNMRRNIRDRRTSSFSYLTAAEAVKYGLDKKINGSTGDSRVDPVNTTDATNTIHKPHHISEVTVTDEGGKRMVYGVPVYNIDQEEVSFSVGAQSTDSWSTARKTGLVDYNSVTDVSANNDQGRFNIYNRKIIPPYTTSFLLSGILSPDYVDRTGDGITDDDLGTAVRFRYHKASSSYHWRAPYDAGKASFNEGFLSDSKDDKASYVYGTKELWYLDTIVSKTMIAIFYKSARVDGYGVAGETGGRGTTIDQQVLKLDSIRLFTKAEMASHPDQPIPIKVAHFEYDYSLYPGLPNSIASLSAPSGRDPLAPYGSYTAGDPYDLTAHTLLSLNPTGGKLTLRKIYFTFGANVRGRTNPYLFSYDMRLISSTDGIPTNPDATEGIDKYTERQADRWGTYKQSAYNWPSIVSGVAQHNLNNSEFPYALQPSLKEQFDTRLLADRFASKWQLNSITVPTGGKIAVEYESDDYAYVQDRKAMEECQLIGVGTRTATSVPANPTTNLMKAAKLFVKVPVGVASQQDLINTYLSGPNGQNWSSIAYKVLTDLNGHGKYEYVIGYAEVDYNNSNNPFLFGLGSDQDIVGIPVKLVNNFNPITKAAWQLLQTDLPQFAYENYDNSDATSFGDDVVAALKSIIQAFVNLRELGQSFDDMASGKKYANNFNSQKSMVRLNTPIGLANGKTDAVKRTYGKLGGGSRVLRVEITDTWDVMAGTNAKPLINGICYEYTKMGDNGKISSGVASYEPSNGNEENPFHEPVPFTEKIQWSQDKYHFIEKPYGESYFPAAEVGYSEVKASNYGADKPFTDASAIKYTNTGYIISRFYTARDFPTQVDYVPLDQRTAEDDLTLFLFASKSTKRVATSQGFKVVLNDMHGKPAFTGVYDNGDNLLSSSEYFYNVQDANAPRKTLNNKVLTLSPDGGTIAGEGNLIGTDEELVTDIRASSVSSNGTSIGAYVGGFVLIWPIPYGFITYNGTSSVTSYNSVSTIKVIHQYGILKETRTTQNGSTLTADNLVWDGLTGQVLLTRTQNEFDDYTYALNYPSHMAYDGMGAAYQNIGTLFTAFLPNGNGTIDSNFSSYLAPGDELVNVDLLSDSEEGIRGWVIPNHDSPGNYRLIDQDGNFVTTNGSYRLVRSGRRNMLSVAVGTVVTAINPLVQASTGGYTLQAAVDKRVLAAKAVTFKDEWDMPVPKFLATTTSTETDSYLPASHYGTKQDLSLKSEALEAFADALFSSNSTTGRRYLYSFESDNVTVANLFNQAISDNIITSDDLSSLVVNCQGQHAPPDYSQLHYYLVNPRNDQSLMAGDQALITWNGQTFATITFDLIPTNYLQTGTASKPTLCATNAVGNCTTGTNYVSQDYGVTACPATGATPDITIRWNSAPVTFPAQTTTTCTDPLTYPINPYYQDIKGVWRMDYDHVYQVNRRQVPGNPAQTGGTNIRTSGYYSSYTPFWVFNTNILSPLQEVSGSSIPHTLTDPRWEWTSKAVHFDQKSNEIESVDPLKRYSSALYGYEQTVATAVATNARQNEIAFDGFEDYNFNLEALLSRPYLPCPLTRHLDMSLTGSPASNGSSTIVSTTAHSGNYSLQLQSLTITQAAGSNDPATSVLGFDNIGRYILQSNEQAAGFAPIPNKQYLLSFWVKDGADETNTVTGLQITINGESKDISDIHLPVVEKWKKVEILFTASTTGFSLALTAGGTMYLDDLRIQPFDSQMKTFVYDDRTMRLTGQLDENNFGVFYEYDEEGTPIRVKKETERGVMTIKENRQSYKKYTQTSN